MKSELFLTGDCMMYLTNEIGCGVGFALKMDGEKIILC